MFVPRSVSRAGRGGRKAAGRDKTAVSRDRRHPTQPREGVTGDSVEVGGAGAEEESDKNVERWKEEEEVEEDEPIVAASADQRWPQAGEPVCVVCGRYGAYVVDSTDRDVCSLECKAAHLRRLGVGADLSRHAADEGEAARDRGTVVVHSEDRGLWVYTEHPAVSCLTDQDVAAIRSELAIRVEGAGVPKPVTDLTFLPLSNQVRANVAGLGYSVLTAVQMQTIPSVLSGKDLIVSAATGSGKTFSFLLPLIARLVAATLPHERASSPHVLILAPTRELCIQIEDQAKEIMKGVPAMKTALVVGGLPIASQLHRLRGGAQFVIATPARLNDVLENHSSSVDLSDIGAFVLDEVDCLLQMGFETQVRLIEERLPPQRQNLMFSATLPPRTKQLMAVLTSSPITISVGEQGAPCASVRHTVMWVEEASKKKKLFACLNSEKLARLPAVVFVSSKMGTLLLADAINKMCSPLSAIGIHGDMAQERRSAIVRGLQEGAYSVVVSTGVLARGLDLVHVNQVFIFDMPTSVAEFVHQVGRAGHLGSPGWATTFINNNSKSVFAELVDLLHPLGVSLPPALTHSPHLSLQREQRKRKRRRGEGEEEGGSSKRKDQRNFYDRDDLLRLIKTQKR